jgi:cell division septation protein DedD
LDIRNLDQIQERHRPRGGGALWPWLLGATSVGALVLTAVMSMPSKQSASESSEDPLRELIASARTEATPPADELSSGNASFPKMLSDRERPSIAFVAVKAPNGRLVEQSEDEAPVRLPAPPPGDELPVVPLPAGELLSATRITAEPQDELADLAADRSRVAAESEPVAPGTEGAFQIQVASFRNKTDAEQYAEELRLRGHSAYSQAARVPNRGLWHRVRIGPFKHKFKALSYKTAFEEKENMATFLVDPDSVERRETQRAAKLAARAKKSKRRQASAN